MKNILEISDNGLIFEAEKLYKKFDTDNSCVELAETERYENIIKELERRGYEFVAGHFYKVI